MAMRSWEILDEEQHQGVTHQSPKDCASAGAHVCHQHQHAQPVSDFIGYMQSLDMEEHISVIISKSTHTC